MWSVWGAVDGTEIDWKPKKNLCTEETRKKQKGGNKGGKKGGQVKYVTAQVAKASFFHFFSDPHMDDEEDDDEGLPASAGGRKHEHQLSVDADYEVGHALRTEVVPNAVG
ncbi:Nap1l1, partial [Symbiodinium microadriaticum]